MCSVGRYYYGVAKQKTVKHLPQDRYNQRADQKTVSVGVTQTVNQTIKSVKKN